MRKLAICLLSAVVCLSACSNTTKEKLGLSKQAPNEFLVSNKAPLTMPPGTDIDPIKPAPSVQPKIVLQEATKEDANFVSNFSEVSTLTKIDAISDAIDKELQRLGKNG